MLQRTGTGLTIKGRYKCGGDIFCGYADLGLVDYYDNYFHACNDCLTHMNTEVCHQGGQNEEIVRCPWCG
ncbi:MAG: hypothetical protein ACFFCW_29860 [Candidatus Hodarchaeota archaeon]